jgi:hypothetical protein
MTDTIRSDSYLTGSEFQDGQASGSISPQDIRDLVVSKANVLDVYDDASNTSGLGAPVIIRGTVYARRAAGVTVGAGQTQTVQQATLTGLQNAINYASSNGKFFEIEPNTYEIYGTTGLTIPAVDGFRWVGSKKSVIKQFASNCPILSIGDVSAGTTSAQDMIIDGARLYYSADQTGQTSSNALQLGMLRNCTVQNISVFAPYSATGPLQKAYRGIYVASGSQNFGFFSNSVRDIMVGGADLSLMDVALVGTGSVFQNIYLTQGVTGHIGTLSGPPLRFVGNADQYETVLDQVNVEWCSSNYLIFAQNLRATTFLSCHFEGNQITGFDPHVFDISSSQISFIGSNLLDMVCQSGVTGTAAIFRCYGDCTINSTNFRISWSGSGSLTTTVNVVALNEFGTTDMNPSIDMTGLSFKDVIGNNLPNLQLSPSQPLASYSPPYALNRYQYGTVIDKVERAVIQLPGTANYTHYQSHVDATIMVPASLSAARTITLSPLRIPSGTGSTLKGPAGNTVKVHRMTGTASNNLLVVNGGAGAGTLTTNTTADTNYYYVFDGTNWAAFT